MKKVRLVGLVGIAPTALGLGWVLPAANAAADAEHYSKAAATPQPQQALSPRTTCGSGSYNSARTGNGDLVAWIYHSLQCIHYQEAYLDKAQTGLTERVRFYSGNGTLENTKWQAGRISGGHVTTFNSWPNSVARKVCVALVANSNHNDVKYGPLCMSA